MLGRVYVWPIKTLDQDLEKTITALSSVAKCDDYQESSELIDMINKEIDELKSRRKSSVATTEISLKPEIKLWWKFW